MNESPLYVLHGNSTIRNRGCQAIALSTMQLLREEFPGCQIVHAPYIMPANQRGEPRELDGAPVRPWTFHRRYTWRWWLHQARKARRPQREPVIELASRATAVLECGGDNFSMDYGLPVRYFQAAEQVLATGCPLVLWGASVGPFSQDPTFEKYAAERLRRFTLICARESATVEYLTSIGVSENVRLVADPAFLLTPQEIDLDREGLGILRQPCVGLNFSSLIGKYHGNLDQWTDEVAQAVRETARRIDLPIVLIPHVFTSDANDLVFLRQARACLGDLGERIVLVDKEYSSRELKFIISRLAAFAGARTHSTIAALSSCVPTVSVSYSMKAKGINRDIFGHEDWVIPFRGMAGGAFGEKMSRLLLEAQPVRKRLEEVIPNMREKVRSAADWVRPFADRRRVRA